MTQPIKKAGQFSLLFCDRGKIGNDFWLVRLPGRILSRAWPAAGVPASPPPVARAPQLLRPLPGALSSNPAVLYHLPGRADPVHLQTLLAPFRECETASRVRPSFPIPGCLLALRRLIVRPRANLAAITSQRSTSCARRPGESARPANKPVRQTALRQSMASLAAAYSTAWAAKASLAARVKAPFAIGGIQHQADFRPKIANQNVGRDALVVDTGQRSRNIGK
jgi:hypothetical protein